MNLLATITYFEAIALLLAVIGAVAMLGSWGANRFFRSGLGPGGAMKKNYNLHPGISMHRMPVGSGIAGLLFTIGCSIIFLGRIPVLRYFLALSMLFGVAIAIVLYYRSRA